MALPESGKFRAVEFSEVVERYFGLKRLGREIFSGSHVAVTGHVSSFDVSLAKKFLAKGARETKPEVWASFFEHAIIAPQLGKLIAQQTRETGVEIDPLLVEFALWPHDISRYVLPAAYLRNELVGSRLLNEIGVPRGFFDGCLSSTYRLMAAAEELKLTDEQIRLDSPLDDRQVAVVDRYFNSLTPTQRITNLADNLGKRDKNGLFTLEAFRQYLKTQERRYDQSSPWPSGASPRRPDGAALQYFTVKKTREWLNNLGVNLETIFNRLADYGPKFVVVVRHGDLDNPKSIVYNRDSVMKSEEIIHLSQTGKKQMAEVGAILKQRRFNVAGLFNSPETRAMESAEFIKAAFGSALETKTVVGLDDALCPGPYIEGMTMAEFMKIKGNVYDTARWRKYNHETPNSIRERTGSVFWRIAGGLKTGEAGVMVSHGDPIAFLLNALDGQDVSPDNLREGIYPEKGEATVAVIGPEGQLFTMYSLNGPQLKGSQRY